MSQSDYVSAHACVRASTTKSYITARLHKRAHACVRASTTKSYVTARLRKRTHACVRASTTKSYVTARLCKRTHACIRGSTTYDDYNCYDLQTKDSCMKRKWLWRASTNLLNKASHLTAFCAWDSSPHLPVTLAQLMRLSIGCPVQWLCA